MLAVGSLAIQSGCYAYLRPDTGPLVGREVQATLTDSGTALLAAKIGPSVDQLRGRVLSENPAAFALALDEAVRRDGTGMPWRKEVVNVPRPLIATIEVRQFSATRTTLFGAITAVALIAVERGFLRGGGSNAPGSSQTGTPTPK